MASSLFYSVRSDLASQNFAQSLGKAFRRNVRTETGIYIGRNRITVSGQQYQFRNTSGLDVAVGSSIEVTNVGRKAAAIYAPTDTPFGFFVGAALLTAHSHATRAALAMPGITPAFGDK